MNDKLGRVCVVSDDYPSENYPVYVFVEQLVSALVDMGEDICVVAPQSLTKALIRHVPLRPQFQIYYTCNHNKYKVYRPYILTFGKGRKWIYHLVNRINQWSIEVNVKKIAPSILYAHFWNNALRILKYAVGNNVNTFVACGEGDNTIEEIMESLSAVEKQKLVMAVKGVISVSAENKRKCQYYGLASGHDMIVLPNAVNSSLFSPRKKNVGLRRKLGVNDNDFLLIFVGGFIPRKGCGILAKAIDSINDSHVKVMFVGATMPGDEDDPHCQGIVYKGKLSHDKLPDYYACADVFVLPTQKEGCSNAIVEALAMGLPVISSTGAFNDDILNESNSIRINPTDVDELANAIMRLRDDVGLRKRLSAGALESAKSLTIDKRAEKIMMFIRQQIEKC